jgi:hypothetical protein
MTDAAKKHKSHDPRKILKKYPDHFPVVCSSSPKGGSTQKLLVPRQMKRDEFIEVARARCQWGKPDSDVRLSNGNPLPKIDCMVEIYNAHKSSDELLHITVHVGRYEDELPRASVLEERTPTSDCDIKADGPQVFHMPDNDNAQPLDDDARRSRRLQKKYPDRVPVLVKQAASIGLPNIDKKLLVPKSMTCAGLQQILPKHLGIQQENGANIEVERLCLFMGDEPLKDNALMSEIYNQYVDEQDGGLHITVRMDLPMESAVVDQDDAADGQEVFDLAVMQAALDEAKEQLKRALAKAEAAEKSAAAKEELLVAEQKRTLEAELKIISLDESLANEVQKVKQLQEEAVQAAEREEELHQNPEKSQGFASYQAAVASEITASFEEKIAQMQEKHAREIAELRQALDFGGRADADEWAAKMKVMEAKAERAEAAKETTDAEAKRVAEKLAALEQRLRKSDQEIELLTRKLASESAEKMKFQKEAKDFAEQLERARDGFVHVHCDRFGFVADNLSEENGFEVLPA